MTIFRTWGKESASQDMWKNSLIEQGLTSHQTHYRSYRGRFLEVIWLNQQCQSTEGNYLKEKGDGVVTFWGMSSSYWQLGRYGWPVWLAGLDGAKDTSYTGWFMGGRMYEVKMFDITALTVIPTWMIGVPWPSLRLGHFKSPNAWHILTNYDCEIIEAEWWKDPVDLARHSRQLLIKMLVSLTLGWSRH